MCQANSLTKSQAHIRDLEDQAWDVGEALRQHRCARERAEKMEEELRAMLKATQHDIRKKEKFCIERYDFSQKMSAQNKDLRALIGSMIEELGMARRSYEASEE